MLRNVVEQINRNKTIAILLASGLFLCSLNLLYLTPLIFSIIFLYTPIKYSLINKFILGIVTYLLTVNLIGHILMFLAAAGSFQLSSALSIIIVSLIAIAIGNNKRYFPKFDNNELIPLFISVLLFLFLVIPIIRSDNLEVIKYMVYGGGEDNSSQFQMYNFSLQNSHMDYGLSNNTNTTIGSSLKSYPQGGHYVSASLVQPFESPIAINNIRSFGIIFCLYYSLLIYLLAAITLQNNRKANYRKTLTVTALIFGLVGFGLYISLLTLGFFGQIVSYLYFIYAIAVIMPIYRRLDYNKAVFSVLLFSLAVFGIATSWYLLIPILFFPYVVFILQNKNKVDKNVLFHISVVVLVLSILITIFFIMSPYSNGSGHVLTVGGVVKLSTLLFAPLVLFIPYQFYLAFKNRKEFLVLLALAISCIALVGAVGAYQLIKIGHFEYYYFKSLYTLLLVTLFISIYSLLNGSPANKASLWYKRYLNIYFTGFVMLVIILANLNPLNYSNAYANVKYHLRDIKTEDTLLRLSQEDTTKTFNYIYVDMCSSDNYDYIATLWSGSINLNVSDYRSKATLSILNNNKEEIANNVKLYEQNSNKPLKKILLSECSGSH